MWTHQYQLPGRYWISVTSELEKNFKKYVSLFSTESAHHKRAEKNFKKYVSLFSTNSAHHELDGTSDAAWLEVEVVEPVTPDMGMEVFEASLHIIKL